MELSEQELTRNEIVVLRDRLRREAARVEHLECALEVARDDAIIANKRIEHLDSELRRLADLAAKALEHSLVLAAQPVPDAPPPPPGGIEHRPIGDRW